MKNTTKANLVSVTAALKAGPCTIGEVTAKTGLNIHQLNGLSGCWTNKVEVGATTPVLWNKTEVGGHVFLVLTQEGSTWAPAKAEAKAKATKAPALTEEAAREALLAQLAQTVTTTEEVGA